MSLLATMFREESSKLKDSRMKNEMEADISYPTGFLNFDFMNGSVIHVKSETQDFKYYNIGITDGSMAMLIGRSGCGKTTLMVQIAANIIRPFKTSCFFFDSVEGGLEETRALTLTKFNREEYKAKVIARNAGVTVENVYERIKMIHDLKLNNRSDFEYDTGKYDSFGNRIYKLEPTVVGLDSLAMLTQDKLTEEEQLSGQMSTTAGAKANAQLYRRITPMLKAANIIFFTINHITDAVSISAFDKKKAQLSFLKPGESLPGGKTPVYVQSTIIRVDDNTKLKEDKEFGIHGNFTDLTLVKSRSNGNGHSCTVVFDENIGFDPELSLFILLKDNDKVHGGGRSFHIDGADDIVFSQKTFKEKLHKEKKLQEAFMNAVIEILQSQMEEREEKAHQEENLDISSSILDMINSKVA